MSYKALSAIKEHVEIETIKNLSPQQVNEVFNKQAARIKELKAENERLKDLLTRVQQDLRIRADVAGVVNLSDGLWRKLKKLTDPTMG